MATLCIATLGSSVLPRSPSPAHLGSLQRPNQFITGPIGGVPYLKSARKGSSSSPPFTIRCLKGVAAPTPDILSRFFNGGVTPTPIPDPRAVTRQDFPPDFIFGCVSSALQTESSATEGGKGSSTWDSMLEGGIGVDSYNRYLATQKGEIGIPLVTQWFEAYEPGRPDKDAAMRAFDFQMGWAGTDIKGYLVGFDGLYGSGINL
ncbi:unnamed protein product [Ilex paraguariensis]|uniref:Uncharacterized protein n=1 Tax=Ilex paraguariensis TaxID=185542 RepID=A0ABC8UPN2_9AQUA